MAAKHASTIRSESPGHLELGYVKRADRPLSSVAERYLQLLQEYVNEYQREAGESGQGAGAPPYRRPHCACTAKRAGARKPQGGAHGAACRRPTTRAPSRSPLRFAG